MASLNNLPSISWIDLYASDTTIPSGLSVGALQYGSDGKAFRYVKNGAVALVAGNVLQSSVIDTQFDAMAVRVAAPAGATSVILTNGTTAVLDQDFVGGTFQIGTSSTASANLGEEYTIVGHSTAISGAALRVDLDRPLRTALTVATTTVNLRRSPWSGVIQAPVTTQTGTIVGVAIWPIPASTATVPQYGWVQTHGVASVLSDGSAIVAGSALRGGLVAGAASLATAGFAIIGQAMKAADSTHTIPVMLTID